MFSFGSPLPRLTEHRHVLRLDPVISLAENEGNARADVEEGEVLPDAALVKKDVPGWSFNKTEPALRIDGPNHSFTSLAGKPRSLGTALLFSPALPAASARATTSISLAPAFRSPPRACVPGARLAPAFIGQRWDKLAIILDVELAAARSSPLLPAIGPGIAPKVVLALIGQGIIGQGIRAQGIMAQGIVCSRDPLGTQLAESIFVQRTRGWAKLPLIVSRL